MYIVKSSLQIYGFIFVFLGDSQIRCPLCNKVTHLGHNGIESLSKNFAIEQVVDAMPPEPRALNRQLSGIAIVEELYTSLVLIV